MNPYLNKLQPYPFEKLRKLFSDINYSGDESLINLSIGEPKSPTPAVIQEALALHTAELAYYPKTQGMLELRQSIAQWLSRRFDLSPESINPEHNVLPVNGTREALFAIAQSLVDNSKADAQVMLPNPFYQIYEGAAILAGAKPCYLDFSVVNGEVPALDNVSEDSWRNTQLLYLCTPGNPTGEVLPQSVLLKLLDYAHRYDFVIVSDECYSEIYRQDDQPPAGLLAAARTYGDDRYQRCLAFYSLSKRSNAPGLRSGFVAGDAEIIKTYLRYRTYHGCSMSNTVQLASIAAWQDEAHVIANRQRYDQSFQQVQAALRPTTDISIPSAGFYLWLPTLIDDEEFAHALYSQHNVIVLPGKYLGREVAGHNPGAGHVRIALVASPEECQAAAIRINQFIQSLSV
jgi:N-succinyldiaminopimelate aminotransferase